MQQKTKQILEISPEKLSALITKTMKEAAEKKVKEMIDTGEIILLKPGDKVKFDSAKFHAAPDFGSLSSEYISFVENSIIGDRIFTVRYDKEERYRSDPVLLVNFEEDEKPDDAKWLVFTGFLKRVEEDANESNQ